MSHSGNNMAVNNVNSTKTMSDIISNSNGVTNTVNNPNNNVISGGGSAHVSATRKSWVKWWLNDQYPLLKFDDECFDYLSGIEDKDLIMSLINKTLQLQLQGVIRVIGIYHLYLTIGFSAELYSKLGLPDGIPMWHEHMIKHAIYLVFDDNLKQVDYQLLFNFITGIVSSVPYNSNLKLLYDSSSYNAPFEKMGDLATIICTQIHDLLPANFNSHHLMFTITSFKC